MPNLRTSLETPAHPAKYSKAILGYLDMVLPRQGLGFDPFAGVGTIQQIRPAAVCIEIEREWARQAPGYANPQQYGAVIVANSLTWMDEQPPDCFAWCVTSCTYANRLADYSRPRPETVIKSEDIAKRLRTTYRHYLGRPLTMGNTGGLQWGEPYRTAHLSAWRHVLRLVRPGGIFALNVSDHIRNGEVIPVAEWHNQTCQGLGFRLFESAQIITPRNGFGQNGTVRVPYEMVYVYTVPS